MATTKSTTAAKKTDSTRKPAGAKRPRKVSIASKSTKSPDAGAKVEPTPLANTPEPVVVSGTKPVLASPSLRKKGLIEAVTARSGVKRKDVKPVIEAMLGILGEAIAEGRDINLPDLGKIKVNRTKKLANGEVFNVRIRQPKITPSEAPEGPKDPLAEAAE